MLSSLRERYELLVAVRMLAGRRSVQFSIVSWMSTLGIGLGVAALIVVLAVNTGFQTAFQERILSTYPHLVVMRRGLDLSDWRVVAARLRRLRDVRSATPATYDDMMLAAAEGRAGAVVRGVPAESLKGLPEGLVVQGEVDTWGEAPRLRDEAGVLVAHDLTIGARHVVVRGAGSSDAAQTSVAVLPPQPGFAGVIVFDADGCRGAVAAAGGGVHLDRGPSTDVLREAERTACGVSAWWEVLDGDLDLVWRVGDREVRKTLPIRIGETTFVAIQGDAAVVVAAPEQPVQDTAAAVALANVGTTAVGFRLGAQEVPVAAGQGSAWLAAGGTLPAIALGEGLAERLGVAIGDEVRAVSPMRADGDGGRGVRGAAGRFRVTAIVRTGFYDHDQRLALCDFTAAQRFLGRGDVARWVDVRIDDPLLAKAAIPRALAALEPNDLHDLLADVGAIRDRLGRVQAELVPGLEAIPEPPSAVAQVDNWVSGVRAARQSRHNAGGLYRVLDWEEMNRNVFDAARMQKVAMSLFPFIIVLIAALNVIGTQAVVVHERARDIAILRAMGARKSGVGAIFLVSGLAVGIVGTALGLLVGGVCCVLLDLVGYPLDPHVYLISRLPVQIEVFPFVLAGGSAVSLCFAAAWLAARRAAERAPVDGLRRLD
ncbi:MAG: ABC transporter permease [Deltaproteobacteria bacterium]|nr:ABC transporter permease [Deltaproteobacteria bacterium]